MSFTNIVSQSVACPLILLALSFCRVEVFNFSEGQPLPYLIHHTTVLEKEGIKLFSVAISKGNLSL